MSGDDAARPATGGGTAVRLVAIEPTFEGWRDAARALLAAAVPPAHVLWRERAAEQAELPGLLPVDDTPPRAEPDAQRRVPRAFLERARTVAAHAAPDRWALLYRVVWRLTRGEPHLLDVSVDDDVAQLARYEAAVRRAAHKTKAFVRFRRIETPDGERFVAWMDPEHDVLPLVAPFFARRFRSMRWTILTPQRAASWDGAVLAFGPGAPRSAAPDGDALDDLWRTYYAHIFNPARVKPAAMRSEMPMKWWQDLPEARLIPDLLHEAPRRVREMHERARTELDALARGEPVRRGRRRRAPDAGAPRGARDLHVPGGDSPAGPLEDA